jgi:hypothetical protein
VNGSTAEFHAAWEAFQQTDSLTLVGDTLEGQGAHGRAQYLALVVRIEDRPVVQYLSDIGARIRTIPGVQMYPGWYLHMTVKGVGFQVIKRTHDDDILRQDLPRLVIRAKDLITEQVAFHAQLGQINAFTEVVFVEVHDAGRVRALNTLLLNQLRGVARYPFDGASFLPHISIARFTSSEGLLELKKALATLREEPLAAPTLAVRRIEFIKAWLVEPIPEFETLATYALAAP